MRFSSLIAVFVMTLILLTTPSTAKAGHRYFANTSPLSNYLNRCLGVGWSDGYHAPGGWAVAEPQYYYHNYPSPVPLEQQSMTRHNHQTHAVPFTARESYTPTQQPAPPYQGTLNRQPWPSTHRQVPLVRQ